MNANKSQILYTEDNIPVETIYVGNICSMVTEKELERWFERFGNVVSVTEKDLERFFEKFGNVVLGMDEELKRYFETYGNAVLVTEKGPERYFERFANVVSDMEEELESYFKTFGKVVSVSINRCGTMYMPYIYAYVTFAEPQSASRALQPNIHMIVQALTKTKAADSSNQPGKHEFYKNSTENDSSKDELTHEDQFPLLNLNDDCLFHIASYLKLTDLLNMSKTCKRLEYVSNVIFASYKSVDTLLLFENLSFMRFCEILAKIGPHVQQIKCDDFVQLLPIYFSNVKLLDLTVNTIWAGDYVYKNIIRTFKNLKTLKLKNCVITDDVCAVLHNCADLETLDLSTSFDITGKHLCQLRNLQKLNLNNCVSLQPEFFKALCMQTKLVSLSIQDCDKLNRSAFETLANTQDKLEYLSISHSFVSSNFIPVTRLKNLKRLTVQCYVNISDNFFQELAIHRGAELEVLKITGTYFNRNIEQALSKLKNLKKLSIHECNGIDSSFLTRMAKSAPLEYFSSAHFSSVSNEGILNLIRFSDTIKKIDVTCCNKITPILVTGAVEILKTKKINKPLILLVGATNINPVRKDAPFLINNRHLIDLSFDYKRIPDEDEDWLLFK